MRFDDRLLTVLNQPAFNRHDSAVRWRQLVDLVARAGVEAASPTVDRALDAIRSDAGDVDQDLRAAAARAVAALPLPLGLLEYFATDRLTVSAPVLAAATLDIRQWRSLLANADEETRAFIETLHPELRGEAPPEPEQPAENREAPAPAAAGASLHDVVERIERRRRVRAPRTAEAGEPADGAAGLFRWECDAGGEIAWVEGAPRGALIGRSIARSQNLPDDGIDQEVTRAFMLRAPFRDAGLRIPGEGSISGEWKISGVPAFDPTDGRFRGYRGVAVREEPPAPAIEQAKDVLVDPDSLRELVHEIKTPLNAIIGFAEIIEGQYLGPADQPYRERAAEIVRQARLLLTGIDDLDFAAKVHSSAAATRLVDVAELVERMAPALLELGGDRGVLLELPRRRRHQLAAVEAQLADRLIYRLVDAVVSEAEDGERLSLSIELSGPYCRLPVSRPAKLSTLTDEELFGGGTPTFEQGFSLRLVRGLARIAGGDLLSSRNALVLSFPRA